MSALQLAIALTTLVCTVACAPPPFATSGTTMGTTFHVTALCRGQTADLSTRIESALAAVNAEMSTYDPDSTLSQFNAAPLGEWFEVSPDMVRVVSFAQSLAERSGGAFDITVGPLVNLFGFGPDGPRTEPPDPELVARARARVGYQYLKVRESPPALRRDHDLYTDLSAVAKGYGVDVVSGLLVDAGCPSHMVEIGGEVYAAGNKQDGGAWRIGIEVPDSVPGSQVERVILLANAAVATSGDYRNFVEWRGSRVSHTFDARRGAPVDHGLASVTVVRPTTLEADGFATLLEVLGPDEGYAFAARAGFAALFIERTEAGFATRYTPAMSSYLERNER